MVIFRGGGLVKKKIFCVRGGDHYMKNKNIGGLSTQPDQQKRPQYKNAQKMQEIIKH